MAIHLGRLLPDASSNQPGRRCENAFRSGFPPLCRPYSVLLPAGFAVPALLPAPRCALTAPFHPYPFDGLILGAFRPRSAQSAIGQRKRRFAFCGTFPGVAPAGRYPAPCFRGARTFLHLGSVLQPRTATAHVSQAAAIRPTSTSCNGFSFRSVKGFGRHGLKIPGLFPGLPNLPHLQIGSFYVTAEAVRIEHRKSRAVRVQPVPISLQEHGSPASRNASAS